jgi:hypothetical protein
LHQHRHKYNSKINLMLEQILISDNNIQNKIYLIRNQKVMLDFDLAALYGVETRALKQSVKRNLIRFPEDFMFRLTKKEWTEVITICDNLPQNIKYSPSTPYAFTEQGVAMLSSILNSDRAIMVNIQIIRVFTRVRQFLYDNAELRIEIERIKTKTINHDKSIELIFQYLDELIDKKKEPLKRERIGYKPDNL